MTPAEPEDGHSTAPPMFTEAQIRRLKFAVIGMGILLVLGFLTVIGRIVYLVSRPSPSLDRPAAAAAVKQDVRLAMPQGAVVRNVSVSGNRLAIHYEWSSGGAVAVVDLATGNVVSTVELAPGAGR